MSAARLASLLLPALGLAACAAAPSGETVGRYPAADAAPDAGVTMAGLPAAAGRVVAVRRIPHANGVEEEIVLEGPRAMSGENRITVEALTSARTGGRGEAGEELKIGPPTDTGVADEMERALPGVAMRLAASPVQGTAGPIGYATGTAGRLSCVYAWQYLAPARPVTLLEGLSDTGALPMSVRVRLCREAPAGSLVDLLRGLRVSRPDGPLPAVAVRPSLSGDALDAAVASLPPAASRGAEAAPAPPAEAARPARKRRHRLAVRPAPRRGLDASARRAAHPRFVAPELADAPRVPLPGDVTAPPRVAAAAQARLPAVASDMPLPR